MDGLTWHCEAVLGNSETLSPYLVSMNGKLTVYSQDPMSHLITCYLIQNHSLVQQTWPPIRDFEHIYQEYPVVWNVNDTWHMIYWETREGEDYNAGLVYSTSRKGFQWSTVEDSLDWVLADETGRVYNWEKILNAATFRQ